jgi:hypothetical protein
MSKPEDYLTPEARARIEIAEMLDKADWKVQHAAKVNLSAARGVAVREFILKRPHGRADYLLFVDGEPVGAVEAKPAGTTLTEVEWQSGKYSTGVPDELSVPMRPLRILAQRGGDASVTGRFGDQELMGSTGGAYIQLWGGADRSNERPDGHVRLNGRRMKPVRCPVQ